MEIDMELLDMVKIIRENTFTLNEKVKRNLFNDSYKNCFVSFRLIDSCKNMLLSFLLIRVEFYQLSVILIRKQ